MFEKVKKFLNGKKQLEQPVVANDSSVKSEATDNRIEKMDLDKRILRYVIIDVYYAHAKDGEISLLRYSPLYYKDENSGIYLVTSKNKVSESDVHYAQETFADYGIKSEILSYDTSNTKKGIFISGATISKLDEKLQEFLFDIAPVVLRNGDRISALDSRLKEINDKLWAKSEFIKMINNENVHQ